MIRSSSHSLKFANHKKLDALKELLDEYRQLLRMMIGVMWLTPLAWDKLYLENDFLQQFNDATWLNQRAIQCCGKQALAMLKASTKKRHKQLYMLAKLQPLGYDTSKLQRKIDKVPLVRPRVSDSIPITLDSRFVHIQKTQKGTFDYFVQIKGMGNKSTIRLPLKATKVSNRWGSLGKTRSSIRINEQQLYLIFGIPNTPKNDEGIVVGADQGQITTLTLSDGQTTPTDYKHPKRVRDVSVVPKGKGHPKQVREHSRDHTKTKIVRYDLQKICDVLARRAAGSKGTQRAIAHRNQYINWSLKQLDYSNVKELRLEQIINIRRGRNTSASLRHWTYTLIQQKLTALAEEEGFVLKEVPNEFRSQRCSQCGWVRKSNRQRKVFKCTACGFESDADLNASCNLEMELADLTQEIYCDEHSGKIYSYATEDSKLMKLALAIRRLKFNRDGFYWTNTRVFYENGCEIVVGDEYVEDLAEQTTPVVKQAESATIMVRHTPKNLLNSNQIPLMELLSIR